MHWIHRFEVKSVCNMLDQHSGIHFTETSSQETSPTPSDMSISLCAPSQILISSAPFSIFPGSLSLACLPTCQVTFLLLLASSATINSSSPLFCTSMWPHPSLGVALVPLCQPQSPCRLGTRHPQQSSRGQDMATFKFWWQAWICRSN